MVSLFEYDQAGHMELIRDEAHEQGRMEGLMEGRQEGQSEERLHMLKTFLENGGTPEMAKNMLKVTDEQITEALKKS